MASGFIILKDGRCFARRWGAYDEIIRIAATELETIHNGQPLSNWLKTQIPNDQDDETADAGWGFLQASTDNWINRELDLRSLTPENQSYFGEAIIAGRKNLAKLGETYSTLPLVSFDVFYEMFVRAEQGEPPMEFNDWIKVADPCTEQNGPGWNQS